MNMLSIVNSNKSIESIFMINDIPKFVFVFEFVFHKKVSPLAKAKHFALQNVACWRTHLPVASGFRRMTI